MGRYDHKELVGNNFEGGSCDLFKRIYKDVSKSFWTDHLERELQMVQLSATGCSCTAIL
jgi:Fe-S cluster biosynthesis and repair protein YggX